MTREIITSQIQDIARVVFDKPELLLTNTLSAVDVDTWTSLSFMQLLSEIEKKFGFKFKMMEILKLQNMGAIIEAILQHVNNA